jgi:hypothetical protein
MLTPNEVRYGNWILVPSDKGRYEWDQVTEISEHRVVTKFYSQNNSMGFAWKDVKGIELTVDLLQLIGFVKTENFSLEDIAMEYVFDIPVLGENKNQMFVIINKDAKEKNWGRYITNNYHSSDNFHYLHQMQNIYFSLNMDKELELNHSKSLQ